MYEFLLIAVFLAVTTHSTTFETSEQYFLLLWLLILFTVYSSCRGLVEVLPLLSQPNGEEAPLANFKLSLKHPIRNVMELCLNLSTYNAILPVLLSLMVHCESDDSKEHFQVKGL